MEKNNEPFKGAVSVKKIANSVVVSNGKIKPTEAVYERFKTFVLRFNKVKYTTNEIENLTDVEKYNLALRDKDDCKIYDKHNYERLCNSQYPMETYAIIYIVNIPKEIIDDNE